MNGIEMLYKILFVEKSTTLWGIIVLGVVIAILSIIYDIGCEQNNE